MNSITGKTGLLTLVLYAVVLTGCVDDPPEPQKPPMPARTSVYIISSQAETEALPSPNSTGAVDVTLWTSAASPEKSLIIGADSGAGLISYHLSGERLPSILAGQPGGVDIRQGVQTAGGAIDLGAFADKSDASVVWFTVDENGPTEIGRVAMPAEPESVCLGITTDGQLQVNVTHRAGVAQLYAVTVTDTVTMSPLARFDFKSRIDGCVFDEARSQLFISEENVGIWRFRSDASTFFAEPRLIDRVLRSSGLTADIEGLTTLLGEDPVLIASSQGNDSFAVYELEPPNPFLFRFSLSGIRGEIDRVTRSDGIAATTMALPGFPKGLIVVHDEDNGDNGEQNLKLIDAGFIALNHPRRR